MRKHAEILYFLSRPSGTASHRIPINTPVFVHYDSISKGAPNPSQSPYLGRPMAFSRDFVENVPGRVVPSWLNTEYADGAGQR